MNVECILTHLVTANSPVRFLLVVARLPGIVTASNTPRLVIFACLAHSEDHRSFDALAPHSMKFNADELSARASVMHMAP
jgi:hypothetical protein